MSASHFREGVIASWLRASGTAQSTMVVAARKDVKVARVALIVCRTVSSPRPFARQHTAAVNLRLDRRIDPQVPVARLGDKGGGLAVTLPDIAETIGEGNAEAEAPAHAP
jgi:hypothetical protein